MTGHINKSNRALKPELAKYLVAVQSMEKYFLGFSICSFPRSQNKQADQLAKAAAQNEPLPADVFFKTLKQGSVNCAEEPAKFVSAITSEDWRATIMAYLRGHFVPEDEKEENRMALHARNYKIINEDIYRGGGRSVRFSSSVYPVRKAGNCWKRYMRGCALCTSEQGPWLAKHSAKASIGLRRWLTHMK